MAFNMAFNAQVTRELNEDERSSFDEEAKVLKDCTSPPLAVDWH